MPNWTYNTITITGEKEELAKMMNDAVKHDDGDGEIRFSSWFPIPETFLKYDTTNHPNGEGFEVGYGYRDGLGNSGIATEELIAEYKRATKEQREKYGVVGWYDYNKKYFGCKWDCEVRVDDTEQDDETLVLSVMTPWTDCGAFLLRMSARYPTLRFSNYAEYEDDGWQQTDYHNGVSVLIDEGDTPEEED